MAGSLSDVKITLEYPQHQTSSTMELTTHRFSSTPFAGTACAKNTFDIKSCTTMSFNGFSRAGIPANAFANLFIFCIAALPRGKKVIENKRNHTPGLVVNNMMKHLAAASF